VDWGTVSLWVLLADMGVIAAVCAYLWVVGVERRDVAA
jgi:hypothetical protein